jgi:Domain of unknown function (DUF4276)
MSPAFLVDGDLEQRFIQKVCPRAPVRKLGCNGEAVKLTEIARRICTQVRALGGKCHPIVVIIDREGRDASAQDIAKELCSEIKSQGIVDQVLIGVADRMIENWILGDSKRLTSDSRVKIPANKPSCFEGLPGKREIKRFCKTYHETTVGVEFLEKASASEICKVSVSFKDFVEKLNGLKSTCYWLRR